MQIIAKPLKIPVMVRGVDAKGYPFMQTADAVRIAGSSVEIAGIDCLTGAADVVSLEYKRRHCRYRISWIGSAKDGRAGRAGLDSLDLLNFIFDNEIIPEPTAESSPSDVRLPPVAATLTKQPAGQSIERRLHPRYAWGANAQVRKKGIAANTPCRVTDISLGGCYVELMMPFPEATAVELDLFWQSQKFTLDARVATSHPSIGMGIAFFGFSAEQFRLLQELIESISGNKSDTPPVSMVAALNPAILTEDLLHWFERHDSLSRQDFEELIQKQKPKSTSSASPIIQSNTGTD